MNAKVLKQYALKCKLHGWSFTFAGLNEFNRLVKKGLRVAPNYDWIK